jgi:hypothetical protein
LNNKKSAAMKTDHLIALLSEDLTPARRGMVLGWLLLGLMGGGMLAVLAMMMTLKPRPDLALAMAGGPFWMKITYTATLAVLGLVIVQRQARAGAQSRTPIMALAAPVVALIVLAAVQLSAYQADSAALLMGQTWTVCPWAILALAVPVYAGLLLALRQLAPTRLPLAGAAAGLAAGAVAATIYGFHCPETAAPFILVWYSLGIVLAAGLGSLVGRFALRW